ncbi:carbohydratebinding protein [Plasmopara halstedii]|uniref:Carbohydratebinding protein n=1 Tax=Plasmopara halstedii TaxID=4781 RepID=A0A0P1AK50_PLAHL|nr:carbohydratebinding protein [Plasmopara halstedii]CEG41490.1 carbohydratebinding protein [Plasmopara halstedii]|eukprot:XP_024577859.1 carbohydratebinding protein [Plasmopara halstedii]
MATIWVLFVLGLTCSWTHAVPLVENWYLPTRCNDGSQSSVCQNYERCKATHRCNRGDEDYDVEAATLKSYTREFKEGEREPIALLNDFEDWKSGTHHWKFQHRGSVTNDSILEPDTWIGWDTFTFPVIGSLELASGELLFDTDEVTLRGDIQLDGILTTTRLGGTSVAVFNFITVYIGNGVRVRFQGNRAIAILSRSSFIVDTELRLRPGTLGGFPGGGLIGASNNRNGPGSSNVRVYVKTLSTWGKHVAEVQEIETSTASGQRIQGYFVLQYPSNTSLGLMTSSISYAATALDVRRRLETAFPDIGEINVERDDQLEQVPEIGRLWRVTFLSAVGNVPQLQAKSFLSGLETKVITRTIVNGNELSGSFRLTFLDTSTRSLAHDVSPANLRKALLEDLPVLIDARVARTDANGQCLQGSTFADQTASSSIIALDSNVDERVYRASEWQVPEQELAGIADSTKTSQVGRCRAGRGSAGGFVWKLQFWTREGNLEATSPSSSSMLDILPPAALTVNASNIQGFQATAEVVDSQCFSLAFGGSGASFSRSGGAGYTPLFGPTYADELVTDLLGGSGGAGGGLEPFDVFPILEPTQGGAGAGAVMISAVNDILFGSNALIIANGGNGSAGFTPGGGGSGGSVLIVSGATVSNYGVLEATGGHGGLGFNMDVGGGGGGSGGRITIYAQSYSSWGAGSLLVSGGLSMDQGRNGNEGSVNVKVRTNLTMQIDGTIGAAGTAKSLLVHGSEGYASQSSSLSSQENQFIQNGPRYVLDEASQPTRISYFVRVGNLKRGALDTNRGAIFVIHASDAADNEAMISVALIDGSFAHEANTLELPRQFFQDKLQTERWYKLDVTLDWQSHTYSIRLNDVLKVNTAAFQGESVAALSLNNLHAMSTWWDEIYVGVDYLLGFTCPWVQQITDETNDGTNEGALLTKKRSWRKLWAESIQKPFATSYHPMVRHESHLSRQEVYNHDNGGLAPFDGVPHRAFFNDVQEQESENPDQGSYEEQQAKIVAGSDEEEVISYAEMLTIENLPLDRTIVEPLETSFEWEGSVGATSADDVAFEPDVSISPSVYWYSEVLNMSTGRGAIGACSSIDYNEWRNEGLMLHFDNLTDPIGNHLKEGGGLLGDRPKVIFNRLTKQFVMWMHVDNASVSRVNTMGLAGIASSEYPNGPFSFHHSQYPDAAPLEAPGGMSINETYDQTLATISTANTQDAVYLIRTYYKTVEYWLPRPVMDPLWQSVQKPSETKPGETVTDFGINYHRAFYHTGYDDPTDIYLQRWRMEDIPWQVICCSPTNTSDCISVTDVPQRPEDICPNGMKKKTIVGQAQTQSRNATTPALVTSRYKDPNDGDNNAIASTSVLSSTSWGLPVQSTIPWRDNYFDALSTNITLFIFSRFAARHVSKSNQTIDYTISREENVSQNIILVNDSEVLDELLGSLGVPISLDFKSKYSSFDLAEIDRNSDGKITSYEIAQLEEQRALNKLTADLVNALLADFNIMKWRQVEILDANNDKVIMFQEFENWLGADPNLLFDRFDSDKNGYLDEAELAQLLVYRQIPRLDTIIFLLDPSFDGRVYYERFRSLLVEVPDYMFKVYDLDNSNTLSQTEISLIVHDLGPDLAIPEVFEILKNITSNAISKTDYATWLSAATSLVGDIRNKLKVDNAIHATGPDRLVGPLHVVERRRAKYVAISALTEDYLHTRGLLREVEGDFEGREALINFFAFSEGLFGLTDASDGAVAGDEIRPFREFLSPAMVHDRPSYWNGRHWEDFQSAPPLFTYGSQCFHVAGLNGNIADEDISGCLPCRTTSPYASDVVDQYQTFNGSTAHCQPQEELDAYMTEIGQIVATQLQYQQ